MKPHLRVFIFQSFTTIGNSYVLHRRHWGKSNKGIACCAASVVGSVFPHMAAPHAVRRAEWGAVWALGATRNYCFLYVSCGWLLWLCACCSLACWSPIWTLQQLHFHPQLTPRIKQRQGWELSLCMQPLPAQTLGSSNHAIPKKVHKSLCSWQTGLVRGVTARRVLQSSALSTRSSIAGRNRVPAAECASHHLPDPSLSLWVTRQPLVRDLSSQQPVPSTRWCYLPTPQTKKLQCHVSTGLERTWQACGSNTLGSRQGERIAGRLRRGPEANLRLFIPASSLHHLGSTRLGLPGKQGVREPSCITKGSFGRRVKTCTSKGTRLLCMQVLRPVVSLHIV